mmetsp:Transcript_2570/g.4115  ORF Transcript_2570/g.4115 Transcript_2570/m.4115 type:complete len:201 (+) Transcript_2570:104-706(+)
MTLEKKNRNPRKVKRRRHRIRMMITPLPLVFLRCRCNHQKIKVALRPGDPLLARLLLLKYRRARRRRVVRRRRRKTMTTQSPLPNAAKPQQNPKPKPKKLKKKAGNPKIPTLARKVTITSPLLAGKPRSLQEAAAGARKARSSTVIPPTTVTCWKATRKKCTTLKNSLAPLKCRRAPLIKFWGKSSRRFARMMTMMPRRW